MQFDSTTILRQPLWAVSEIGQSVDDYMSKSSSLADNWFIILAVLSIFAFWAGLFAWDKYRSHLRGKPNTEKSLVADLCRAHNLTRQEHALLDSVATNENIACTSILFVDPRILSQVAHSNPDKSTACRAIAAKIFGNVATE